MAEILNLVNPKDSLSFKYEISRFPDGQQSLRLIEDGYNTFNSLKNAAIKIKSRLNNFQDLEIIICATQALREVGVNDISLYIPYCVGARSDRKFSEGGINYVKTVIAPIINSQGYSSVTILDPHSDVLEACINNFKKINNFNLVNFSLKEILLEDWRKTSDDIGFEGWYKYDWLKNPDIVLVSPDAGAYKKIFDVAENFRIKSIATAVKVRDLETGKILRTEVPNLPISTTGKEFRYVIIDDICDGGRTFIELAKAIKASRPTAEIYLVVTHGIFSAGYAELGKYFNGIYCTNSVKDIVHDPEDTDLEREMKEKVKQLNVF